MIKSINNDIRLDCIFENPAAMAAAARSELHVRDLEAEDLEEGLDYVRFDVYCRHCDRPVDNYSIQAPTGRVYCSIQCAILDGENPVSRVPGRGCS